MNTRVGVESSCSCSSVVRAVSVRGNIRVQIKSSLSYIALGICWLHGDLYGSIGQGSTEDRKKDRQRKKREMEMLIDLSDGM